MKAPHCGAEAVHLACSRDGGNFSALHNNTPVLRGPDGRWSSVRDPFIDRDPHDPSLFHIVATAGGFGRGISAIHHWNLSLASGAPVFGPHTLLNVMASVNGTEECWAPEWVWDDQTGRFLIHFASGTRANPDGGVQTKSIWAVWAPSFAPLSNLSVFRPFPLLQPGHSVIDANVVRVSGARIDMFLKDESCARSPDFVATSGRRSRASPRPGSAGRSPLPASRACPLTAAGTEGPELVHFPSNGFGVGECLLCCDTHVSTCFGASTLRDCVVSGSCALNCSGCVVAVSPDITNPKNVTVPSPS